MLGSRIQIFRYNRQQLVWRYQPKKGYNLKNEKDRIQKSDIAGVVDFAYNNNNKW